MYSTPHLVSDTFPPSQVGPGGGLPYNYIYVYIYTRIYIYTYTKKQHKTSKQTSQPLGWELLDTKSGKARPCSPPESDEDSVIRGEVAGCP